MCKYMLYLLEYTLTVVILTETIALQFLGGANEKIQECIKFIEVSKLMQARRYIELQAT
jgi:hypothetical protein